MRFRFNQALRLATVAGAIAGLAACGGGGGGGALVTTDLPAITVGADTQAIALKYAALLLGKTASLPSGIIFTEAGAPTVTSGTTFTFTAIPAGAPSNTISGFQLGTNYGTFSGYIKAGSTIVCGKGTWNNVTYPVPPSLGDADGNVCFTINGNMVIDPATDRLVPGTQNIDIRVSITGGGTAVDSTVTTSVTVAYNADGTTATITDPISGTSFTVATAVVTGAI